MKRFEPLLAGIAALIACSAPATAESFRFEFEGEGNVAEISKSFAVPLAGTLIGNYDPVSNPGGTQTRPGLFGGSGNIPVPYTATFSLVGDLVGTPSGFVDVDWVPGDTTATLTALELDPLGGVPGDLEATLTILFGTFRTYSPDSIFPGGTPYPLPFGAAAVSSISIIATAPAAVAVVANKTGWTLSALVEVEISAIVNQSGEDFLVGPSLAVIPVSGTLIETPAGYLLAGTAEGTQTFDEPTQQDFPPQPTDVPTVLPPGSVAHLIVSGTANGVSGESTFVVDFSGLGTEIAPPADLNGDGIVNGADLAILLAAWGPCPPKGACPADLNDDGIVNGADLAILLGEWTPGG